MSKAFILSTRISFLNTAATATPDAFAMLFGAQPEAEGQQRDSRQMSASMQGQDSRRRWLFQLASQAGRFDVAQRAEVDPRADTSAFSRLQPVAAVLQESLDRVLGKPAAVPWDDATRVAIGCTVQWPVADDEAANRLLVQYVPGLPITNATDRDVLFRRNQPCDLILPDATTIRGNRIATWQSAMSLMVMISAAPAAIQTRRLVILETDCSSTQERSTPLGPATGSAVLRCLLDHTIAMIPHEEPA